MKLKLLTILFILIPITFAYIAPTDFKGVKIKHYDNLNCNTLLETVPEKYLERLDYIKFRNRSVTGMRAGYWWANGIELYEGCEASDLAHELAHHLQFLTGHRKLNGRMHLDPFIYFEETIYHQMLGNQINNFTSYSNRFA